MPGIQWLLQSNHPNLTLVREMEIVLAEQHTVHMVGLKAFTTELPDISMLDPSRPTVCYGPSFVPRAFGHPELSPGIFFDPATFCWSAFRDKWTDLMLAADAVVTFAYDAPSRFSHGPMFARPDLDSKAFDGGLYDTKTYGAAVSKAMEKDLMDGWTNVVVASPLPIDAEWRTFIVDVEVVAASSYRKAGVGNIDLHVPHAVIDLAFEAVDRWGPASVFCLDIALSGDRYGIVEANCFNASRFYGADAIAILSTVSAFVTKSEAEKMIRL